MHVRSNPSQMLLKNQKQNKKTQYCRLTVYTFVYLHPQKKDPSNNKTNQSGNMQLHGHRQVGNATLGLKTLFEMYFLPQTETMSFMEDVCPHCCCCPSPSAFSLHPSSSYWDWQLSLSSLRSCGSGGINERNNEKKWYYSIAPQGPGAAHQCLWGTEMGCAPVGCALPAQAVQGVRCSRFWPSCVYFVCVPTLDFDFYLGAFHTTTEQQSFSNSVPQPLHLCP